MDLLYSWLTAFCKVYKVPNSFWSFFNVKFNFEVAHGCFENSSQAVHFFFIINFIFFHSTKHIAPYGKSNSGVVLF